MPGDIFEMNELLTPTSGKASVSPFFPSPLPVPTDPPTGPSDPAKAKPSAGGLGWDDPGWDDPSLEDPAWEDWDADDDEDDDPPRKTRQRKATSQKQRDANKRNAARSTGPRTAAGKAKSACNALRHGVFSQASVLPGESWDELNALEERLYLEHQPVGPMEEFLLGRLVALVWKLARLGLAEQEYGWSQIHHRIEVYRARVKVAVMFKKDLNEIKVPNKNSDMAELLRDDFQENGKPGHFQQMTNLEIRLTGQMLAVTRQLVQLRKMREKAEEGREESGRRAKRRTAPRRKKKQDIARKARSTARTSESKGEKRMKKESRAAAARNEPISKDCEQTVSTPPAGQEKQANESTARKRDSAARGKKRAIKPKADTGPDKDVSANAAEQADTAPGDRTKCAGERPVPTVTSPEPIEREARDGEAFVSIAAARNEPIRALREDPALPDQGHDCSEIPRTQPAAEKDVISSEANIKTPGNLNFPGPVPVLSSGQ